MMERPEYVTCPPVAETVLVPESVPEEGLFAIARAIVAFEEIT